MGKIKNGKKNNIYDSKIQPRICIIRPPSVLNYLSFQENLTEYFDSGWSKGKVESSTKCPIFILDKTKKSHGLLFCRPTHLKEGRLTNEGEFRKKYILNNYKNF